MSDKMVLSGYVTLKGTLHCKAGLHIGAPADVIEIGGVDNPIIKHPITKLPYVPGSSLKGKMRSLLELRHDKINPKDGSVHKPKERGGYNCNGDTCLICRLFGASAGEGKLGPARLIVRDAYLTPDWETEFNNRMANGDPITEIKYENTIDRITAKANPRPMERVPAGVVFSFEIGYRVFDTGDEGATDRKLFKHLSEGLRLVELDTLGGSGSRGYGKVEFRVTSLVDFDNHNKIATNLADKPEDEQWLSITELMDVSI